MSRRIALTDTEIEYILDVIKDYSEDNGQMTQFTREGIRILKDKLQVSSDISEGLLKVYHE